MLNLKKLLTKILKSITASSTTATASGSPSASLCRCVKVGNVVHISGFYRRTSDISSSETLFTIPTAYRPSAQTSIAGYLATGSGYSFSYYVNINADGTIKQNAGNTMREIYFSGSYLV